MPKNVIVRTNRTRELAKRLDSLAERRVLVGIPAEDAGRNDPGSPINNATLGYLMETGSPSQNIPARPFLAPGVKSAKADLVAAAHQGMMAVIVGRATADDLYTKLGLIAQNAVVRTITNGPFVPLAPSTLAARKARGVTRTNPLNDTGQLRASISFVVRQGGDAASRRALDRFYRSLSR